jgi:hypothetical protein
MGKLLTRRKMLWQFIGAAVLLFFSGDAIFNYFSSSDDWFKHQQLGQMILCGAFGVGFTIGTAKQWREQNNLENTWRQIATDSDRLKDVYKNPALYRPDFKAWINENYPHLKIWEPPENPN